ncbi:hypothetical protein P7C70_g6613, partial [Phenoliferia sp. Uapishka_3]
MLGLRARTTIHKQSLDLGCQPVRLQQENKTSTASFRPFPDVFEVGPPPADGTSAVAVHPLGPLDGTRQVSQASFYRRKDIGAEGFNGSQSTSEANPRRVWHRAQAAATAHAGAGREGSLSSSCCGADRRNEPLHMVDAPLRRSSTRSKKADQKASIQAPSPEPPIPLEPLTLVTQTALEASVRRDLARFPDCLLLTQVGSFYESYFEQAPLVAKITGIKLTSKQFGKGDAKKFQAFCGFPLSQLPLHLSTLVEAGRRVVIVDEVREGNEISRKVSRVVTPGTGVDEGFVKQDQMNFVLAIGFGAEEKVLTLAWRDVSTGAYFTKLSTLETLRDDLLLVEPKEVVISSDLAQTSHGEPVLSLLQSEAERESWLISRSKTSPTDSGAQEILSAYLASTLVSTPPPETNPTVVDPTKFLQMDSTTLKSLEIRDSLRGGVRGTLVSTVRRTVTPGGARLLTQRLSSPSTETDVINHRLSLVSSFITLTGTRQYLRALLKRLPDSSRLLQRLYLRRGKALDLVNLKKIIAAAKEARQVIHDELEEGLLVGEERDALKGFAEGMEAHSELATSIDMALDEKALLMRTLRAEKRAGLEEALGHGAMEKMEAEGGEDYTDGHWGKNEEWVVRSDLVNSFTPQLAFLHEELAALRRTASELEGSLKDRFGIKDLELRIVPKSGPVVRVSLQNKRNNPLDKIEADETITALAKNASSRTYSLGAWTALYVQMKDVMSQIERVEGETVTSLVNDNMAGKSTFLRQNALVVILAQAGCFVPAESVEMGLVDRVFSRVGARDELDRDRSTFFIEMDEATSILRTATDRSLVLLDELGRGTSPLDGLAIAYAALEHIVNVNRSRTLFATHYHRLGELMGYEESNPRGEGPWEGVEFWCTDVHEKEDSVSYSHNVRRGLNPDSAGLIIARLSGMPSRALRVARERQTKSEQEHHLGIAPMRSSWKKDSRKVHLVGRQGGSKRAKQPSVVVQERRKHWTPEEDSQLQTLVSEGIDKRKNKDWKGWVPYFEGRSVRAMKERWSKMTKGLGDAGVMGDGEDQPASSPELHGIQAGEVRAFDLSQGRSLDIPKPSDSDSGNFLSAASLDTFPFLNRFAATDTLERSRNGFIFDSFNTAQTALLSPRHLLKRRLTKRRWEVEHLVTLQKLATSGNFTYQQIGEQCGGRSATATAHKWRELKGKRHSVRAASSAATSTSAASTSTLPSPGATDSATVFTRLPTSTQEPSTIYSYDNTSFPPTISVEHPPSEPHVASLSHITQTLPTSNEDSAGARSVVEILYPEEQPWKWCSELAGLENAMQALVRMRSRKKMLAA